MRRMAAIVGLVLAVIAMVVAIYLRREGEIQGRDAMSVATAFLESYYVSINLGKAAEFTESRARDVILRQLNETKKVPPTERNPSNVKYRLLKERSLGEQKKAFSFELSIEPQGGGGLPEAGVSPPPSNGLGMAYSIVSRTQSLTNSGEKQI